MLDVLCKVCGKPAAYKAAQLCRTHYVAACRAAETQEERNDRRNANKLRMRKVRGKDVVRPYGQPKEQVKAARKEYFKEYNANRRANETKEQHDERIKKQREYMRKVRAKYKD